MDIRMPEVDGIEATRRISRDDDLATTRALIGRYLRPPQERVAAPAALSVLTDRERELVAVVAEGLSNEAIASRLVLSPLTVETHVNRAMMKPDACDRAQLVVLAYQSGLVRPPTP